MDERTDRSRGQLLTSAERGDTNVSKFIITRDSYMAVRDGGEIFLFCFFGGVVGLHHTKRNKGGKFSRIYNRKLSNDVNQWSTPDFPGRNFIFFSSLFFNLAWIWTGVSLTKSSSVPLNTGPPTHRPPLSYWI